MDPLPHIETAAAPAQSQPAPLLSERVKALSLRASGIGFLIGDAAFFAADRMNKDTTGSWTGLTYLAGAAVAARYGKESPQHHLHQMQRKLRTHLVSQGVAIPTGATLDREELKKPQGLVDQVETFFYRYPSQILNGMFAVGGTFKVAAGIRKTEGKYSTMAYGGLVVLAGLTGLLIPEKEPDITHPPTSFFGKVKEKVQAQPLRVASAIYLVNNGNLVLHAIQQRKEHLLTGSKPGYPLTFLTACAYILSNGLLGVASKDSSKSSGQHKQYVEALEDAAAEVLRTQSPELQDALVKHVAEYLSAQPEIKRPAQELAAAIHARLGAVKDNRQSAGWQQKLATTAAAEIQR